jgi:hypothetical protein
MLGKMSRRDFLAKLLKTTLEKIARGGVAEEYKQVPTCWSSRTGVQTGISTLPTGLLVLEHE